MLRWHKAAHNMIRVYVISCVRHRTTKKITNTYDVKLKSKAGYVQIKLTGKGGLAEGGISKSLIIIAAPILAPLFEREVR